MFPSLSGEALAAGLSPNESLFAAGSNAKFLASDPGTSVVIAPLFKQYLKQIS